MVRPQRILVVCQNARPPEARASCAPTGGEAFLAAVRCELKKHGLKGPLRAVGSSCLGVCEGGPHCVVFPDAIWYSGFTAEDAREIVEEHLLGGRPVERLRAPGPDQEPHVRVLPDGLQFPAKPGATLLDSALDHGVPLPFGCQSAKCGVCRVEVSGGAAGEAIGLHPPSTLEAAVLEGFGCPSGVRLACQARVRGPVTVRPSAGAAHEPSAAD
ncbi:MAG TPA: 2Fe-2S iron-sulfur cluster-binding protein [Planctomycetota bacterium]